MRPWRKLPLARGLSGLAVLTVLCRLAAQDPAEAEQQHLGRLLAEAGNSTPDYVRALEAHLAKYPKSSQRAEIERSLVKTAVETKDDRRLLRYGPAVLVREGDQAELLERLALVLLRRDDRQSAEIAWNYGRRLADIARATRWSEAPAARLRSKLRQDHDRALGKALVYQSRAAGNLDRREEAVALARQSYQVFPSGESAREIARWLERLGRTEEALAPLADAFTIPDEENTDVRRAEDRVRLGEWYRRRHESETGLGGLVLAAWDRTARRIVERRAEMRRIDPNFAVTDPMEFTLSGPDGESLALASVRGRILVLDFWATWCGPCRAQQPLYEQVKERFRNHPEILFLNVSTDQSREVVKPFLEQNGWSKTVWFDDGLAALLHVASIPTTIVFNSRAEVVSRMNGFLPDRFADMLSERIEQALADAGPPTPANKTP